MIRVLKIILKSFFIAIFLMMAICFEGIKIRMSIAMLLYLFSFFIILKGKRRNKQEKIEEVKTKFEK